MNALRIIVSANINAQQILLRSPVMSLLAISLLTMSLTACGQSGPLFLPKPPEPLKTRAEPPKTDSKSDPKNELKNELKDERKAEVKAGAQAEPAR